MIFKIYLAISIFLASSLSCFSIDCERIFLPDYLRIKQRQTLKSLTKKAEQNIRVKFNAKEKKEMDLKVLRHLTRLANEFSQKTSTAHSKQEARWMLEELIDVFSLNEGRLAYNFPRSTQKLVQIARGRLVHPLYVYRLLKTIQRRKSHLVVRYLQRSDYMVLALHHTHSVKELTNIKLSWSNNSEKNAKDFEFLQELYRDSLD